MLHACLSCEQIVSSYFLQAIHRLGGTQMKLECDHLKIKSLDQTNQELIKQSNDEIKLLKESYKLLQEDHRKVTKEMEILKSTLNDTVPWNIRGKQL